MRTAGDESLAAASNAGTSPMRAKAEYGGVTDVSIFIGVAPQHTQQNTDYLGGRLLRVSGRNQQSSIQGAQRKKLNHGITMKEKFPRWTSSTSDAG
jgi:hypothetical protein